MIRLFSKIRVISPFTNFLVGMLYAYVYEYVYKNYIATVWEYTALRQYQPMSAEEFITYLLIASIPFVFYKGIKYFAAAFSLFVYIFVYIPFVNALFVYGFPSSMKTAYLTVFFILMTIYFMSDKYALFKNWVIGYKRRIPFAVIPSITIVLFVLLLAVNRSQLHFVNFFVDSSAMYEFRENSDIRLIYVLCWLRSAFLPLLMLYYLNKGNYIKYGVTFIGFVLIFMLDQQKMTIIFPFAITCIFFAIKYYQSHFYSMFHLFIIALFVVIPLIIIKYQENPIVSVFALIFIVRIQCIAGKQMEKYLEFFDIQNNPYTYYTHIGIVNALTGLYPYKESIGEAINYGDGNSNATFFLMDGVAAGGVLGCILIGVLFFVVKSMLNSLSYVYSVPLLTALFLFPLQSLMNVSLFTSLFSHGAILLFIILLTVDIKEFRTFKTIKYK